MPKNIEKIIVKNVLFELAVAMSKVFPNSDIDFPDLTVKKPLKNNYKGVKFGNNVLIGKNVKIGKNSSIGANTIIEHNVIIGDNCIVGSNVILKNSIIGNNVMIQDGSKKIDVANHLKCYKSITKL